MIDWSRYVGLPFVDKGRDWAGIDCWGLLRLVYAETFGLDLPSFADGYATTADRVAVAALIGRSVGRATPWQTVASGAERPGDGILIREGGEPRHVGIVVRPGRMLHATREAGAAVIENYRGCLWRRRIIGFYRHHDLA